MSGGGKSTNTSTTVNQIPKWIEKGGAEVWKEARTAAAANPVVGFGSPTSAGSNANIDAASATALGSTGAGAADLERARQLTEQGATAVTPRVSVPEWNQDASAKYMNPFLSDVQGRTLDEMKRRNAMEIADVGDGASRSKAFGGTRHAVLEAETRKGQNSNMIDYLARSNSDAYENAYGKFAGDRSAKQSADTTNAGIAAGDAARTMAGGGQFAGMGAQTQQMAKEDVDMLLRTGLIDQQTADNMIQGDYSEFLRMQEAPMLRYMQLMGMLNGAPYSQVQKTTETSRGGQSQLLPTLLGIGSIAASAFSDRRLKRDIVKIGELAKGVGLYLYRYVFDDEWFMGSMADEVSVQRPDAVKQAFGFAFVDYAKLGV